MVSINRVPRIFPIIPAFHLSIFFCLVSISNWGDTIHGAEMVRFLLRAPGR
jgi:hypothetical protein